MYDWVLISMTDEHATYGDRKQFDNAYFHIEIERDKFTPPEKYRARITFSGETFEIHNQSYFTPQGKAEWDKCNYKTSAHWGSWVPVNLVLGIDDLKYIQQKAEMLLNKCRQEYGGSYVFKEE